MFYRLAKAAREEKDAAAAHERNQEVLGVLRKQMAALEEQKEEARRLKEEEAQLLVRYEGLWGEETDDTLEEQELQLHLLTRTLIFSMGKICLNFSENHLLTR